jgi:signal peptidase II
MRIVSNGQQEYKEHRGLMLKWLWLSVIVVIIDLVTKNLASKLLDYNVPVPVTSFFSLTLSYNPGAAFSFLAGQSGWQRWFFIGLTLAVCCVLLIWVYRLRSHERWLAIALSLVLGGASGNLYDRIISGHVIDFLHFHYFFDFDSFQWNFSYPVFNFADSFICIGAGMLAIDIFRSSRTGDSTGGLTSQESLQGKD